MGYFLVALLAENARNTDRKLGGGFGSGVTLVESFFSCDRGTRVPAWFFLIAMVCRRWPNESSSLARTVAWIVEIPMSVMAM